MATLARLRVAWSGSGVTGAGVSTFYSSDSLITSLRDGVIAFFNDVKNLTPSVVNWHVPAAGETIESTTGELNGSWSGGTPVTITGTLPGQGYAQGVGARVVWQTAGIVGGRRVRGTTFLVPLSSGVYDSDGTLKAANLATLNSAAANLVTAAAGDMVVYSRPTSSRAGVANAVTSGAAPDSVSWLVSRRR